MRRHWMILVTAALMFAGFVRAAPAQAPGLQAPVGNATSPTPPVIEVQPVPGAMAGSDAVPSTISERNANDDKLPTIAFRLRGLTDDQRRTIIGGVEPGRGDLTVASALPEVGTVVPQSDELRSLPPELGARVPEVKDLQYETNSQAVVLVDPLQHAVLAVLSR